MITYKTMYLRLALLLSLLLSACSTQKVGVGDIFSLGSKASTSQSNQEKIEKNSKLFHHYLSAQLSYAEQDIDNALTSYEQASSLSSEPIEKVERRLVELHLLKDDLDAAIQAAIKSYQAEPQAYKLNLLASIYYANDNFLEAVKVYQENIKANSDQKEAYIYLAILYLLDEDYTAVKETIAKTDHFKNFLLYYLKGLVADYEANTQLAEKYYKRALALEPENTQVLTDLARLYLTQNRTTRISALIKEEIKAPHLTYLKRQIKEGKPVKDYASKGAFLRKNPEDIFNQIHYKLAQDRFHEKQFDIAINKMLVLNAIHPDYSNARFFLATAFSTTNRVDEGVYQLLKIKEDDPLFVRSRIFSALLLKKDEQLEEAQSVIEEALSIAPDKVNLIKLYVSVLREQKKIKKVRDVLEDAVDRFKEDGQFLFDYAVALHELGEKEESQEILHEILVRDPEHSDALNFIAYTYAEENRELDLALRYISKALEKNPTNPFFLDTLAWIYFKQGSVDKAEKIILQALRVLPDDPVLLEHYGDILFSQGNHDSAQDYYQQAYLEAKDAESSVEIDELLKRLKKKLK